MNAPASAQPTATPIGIGRLILAWVACNSVSQNSAKAATSHRSPSRAKPPGRRSARARRDDEIREQIERVHADSFGLYGSRKVWQQVRRDGIEDRGAVNAPHGARRRAAWQENGDDRRQPESAVST